MIETELDEAPLAIKVAFLDVGQADTIVISSALTQEAIIIDCVNAEAVLSYLAKEQIKYLRGTIITHLHADHFSGVANLLNNYHQVPGMQECEVVAFNEDLSLKNLRQLPPDADGHSSSYEQPSISGKRFMPTYLSNLFLWCKQHRSQCANLKFEKRSLPFEGVLEKHLKLLHPHFADYPDLRLKGLNNTSAVLRVVGSKASVLLTGDLEPEGWKLLCANHPDLYSDVLKFPHHGGAWKYDEVNDLLDKVCPSIVVISVGSEGFEKYAHPHPDIFKALAKRPHIRLLCTQATNQCHLQHLVQSERNTIVHQFKAEADKIGNRFFLSNSRGGCPCAGTIIIELGEKAQVLQPDVTFHHEKIIVPHLKAHQCSFELDGPRNILETEIQTT